MGKFDGLGILPQSTLNIHRGFLGDTTDLALLFVFKRIYWSSLPHFIEKNEKAKSLGS